MNFEEVYTWVKKLPLQLVYGALWFAVIFVLPRHDKCVVNEKLTGLCGGKLEVRAITLRNVTFQVQVVLQVPKSLLGGSSLT